MQGLELLQTLERMVEFDCSAEELLEEVKRFFLESEVMRHNTVASGQPHNAKPPMALKRKAEAAIRGAIKRVPTKGKLIPVDDWIDRPSLTREQALEMDKMVDWARGKGERRADWGATWRNWWRRVEADRGTPAAPLATTHQKPTHGLLMDNGEVWIAIDTYEWDMWASYRNQKMMPPRYLGGGQFPSLLPPINGSGAGLKTTLEMLGRE